LIEKEIKNTLIKSEYKNRISEIDQLKLNTSNLQIKQTVDLGSKEETCKSPELDLDEHKNTCAYPFKLEKNNRKMKQLEYKLTDFGISFDCVKGNMIDFGMDKYLAPEVFGSKSPRNNVLLIIFLIFRSTSENSIFLLCLFHS
jgi:hypothetical protein